MNTANVVKTAGLTLDEQIKIIQAATKTGDSKALSNAIRRGGIASVIVEKGEMIASDPEKYEKAAQDSDVSKIMPSLAKLTDERAKAEGFLRFKAAFRAAAQVRRVEALLTKMSEEPTKKSRKVRPVVVAIP